MTQEQINEQIEVIRRVGAEVSKSKESAQKFLIDAGIIKKDSPKQTLTTHKTK